MSEEFETDLLRIGIDKDNLRAWRQFQNLGSTEELRGLVGKVLSEDSRILTVLGKQGTGKSFTVCAELEEYLKGKWLNNKDITQMARVLTHFEFDLQYKECMNPRASKCQSEVYQFFTSIQILVIDEIGRGSWSDYSAQFIENVIAKRYANEKKTILITNKTPQELSKMFDVNILDRLGNKKYGLMIVMKGESLR